MIQPDLFNNAQGASPAPTPATGPAAATHMGDYNLPRECRAAAQEQAKAHSGIMKLVAGAYLIRPNGATADSVASDLGKVINTVRRCVHYLDKEKVLIPMAVGKSCNGNPQTLYIHKVHAAKHQEAITRYANEKANTDPL